MFLSVHQVSAVATVRKSSELSAVTQDLIPPGGVVPPDGQVFSFPDVTEYNLPLGSG